MHQHHGDLAGPVRLQHEQAVLGAVARQRACDGAAAQQGGNLDRVERALIERRGECSGRVELERLGLSVHRDHRGLVRGIHLEASTHLSAGETGARVFETQQGRRGDPARTGKLLQGERGSAREVDGETEARVAEAGHLAQSRGCPITSADPESQA